MTDNDLSVAKDIGSLQADMRTVKHDIAQISGKIDGSQAVLMAELKLLGQQVQSVERDRAKGFGFIAGSAAVISILGGFIVWLINHIPGIKL